MPAHWASQVPKLGTATRMSCCGSRRLAWLSCTAPHRRWNARVTRRQIDPVDSHGGTCRLGFCSRATTTMTRQITPSTAVMIHAYDGSGRKRPMRITSTTQAMVVTMFSTTTVPSSTVVETSSSRFARRRLASSTLAISPTRAARMVLNRKPTMSGLSRSMKRVLCLRPGRPSTTPFHASPLRSTDTKLATTAMMSSQMLSTRNAATTAPQSILQMSSTTTTAMTPRRIACHAHLGMARRLAVSSLMPGARRG